MRGREEAAACSIRKWSLLLAGTTRDLCTTPTHKASELNWVTHRMNYPECKKTSRISSHQNICEFDFRPQLPVTILRFVRKVPAARRHAKTHQEVLRGAAQVGHCLAMHNYMRLVHAVAKEPMAAIHHYNLTRSRQVTLSLLPPVLAGPDSRGHELGRGSCRTLRIPRRRSIRR